MRDLHLLPKVRDSLSYLYIEHVRVEQEAKAIAIYDKEGKTPVPCAALTLLMLGPGTSITHAAIRALTENGCLVMWTGEEAVRTYAQGMGETRSSARLLHQARMWADPQLRLQVVVRMYRMRFKEPVPAGLTLQQLRGREGVRVRDAYARWSRETGVSWSGRGYNRGDWASADPVNRALSAANSCLYGVCQAAIVSLGYSPALGFIHTGKMLSFVYDIADLYKVDISVPLAFEAAALSGTNLEGAVRRRCRDLFHEKRLLQRIVPDIDEALRVQDDVEGVVGDVDTDMALPAALWDPSGEIVPGGVNRAEESGT